MPPHYLFVFEDEGAALRFVERLVIHLQHLAIYRDGIQVYVLDGGDSDRRREIVRLARESAAQMLKV